MVRRRRAPGRAGLLARVGDALAGVGAVGREALAGRRRKLGGPVARLAAGRARRPGRLRGGVGRAGLRAQTRQGGRFPGEDRPSDPPAGCGDGGSGSAGFGAGASRARPGNGGPGRATRGGTRRARGPRRPPAGGTGPGGRRSGGEPSHFARPQRRLRGGAHQAPRRGQEAPRHRNISALTDGQKSVRANPPERPRHGIPRTRNPTAQTGEPSCSTAQIETLQG